MPIDAVIEPERNPGKRGDTLGNILELTVAR
jgi:hypothetical protein